MNERSLRRLAEVHPVLSLKVQAMARKLKAHGVTIEVVSGLRTIAEQDALFAKGRTMAGKRVTNARGGQSWHNFGLAVDVAPFKSGGFDWNALENVWKQIGAAAKAEGLEWGGDWRRFPDRPHVQLHSPVSLAQMLLAYKRSNGDLREVWREASVAENFA